MLQDSGSEASLHRHWARRCCRLRLHPSLERPTQSLLQVTRLQRRRPPTGINPRRPPTGIRWRIPSARARACTTATTLPLPLLALFCCSSAVGKELVAPGG